MAQFFDAMKVVAEWLQYCFIWAMSNMLLTMLTMPKPNDKERAIVAIVLECCPLSGMMPNGAWKANKGNSEGVDEIVANKAPPTMVPSTNTATIAYL